jgi:hypothetical protein
MTAKAYAIAVGRLLVDTVRASECSAREAAVKQLKQPGVGWRDLERRGYFVVQVTIATVAPSPRASTPITALVVAAAEAKLKHHDPDRRPIRRLIGGRSAAS